MNTPLSLLIDREVKCLSLRYVNAAVGEASVSLRQPAGPSIQQNPDGRAHDLRHGRIEWSADRTHSNYGGW